MSYAGYIGGLPARLTVEQAAWVLGCQPHDVPILVASRLLKPLGNPPSNGIKFFGTADLLELVKDRSWLVRMTNAVCQHWQKKNARKTCQFSLGETQLMVCENMPNSPSTFVAAGLTGATNRSS